MMVRFDLSTSMDTGHDGDDPAHPLERYGEAGQEGEGEMKGTPRAPWRMQAAILVVLRKRNGGAVVGEGAPARWRLKEAAN
jgi:hypothetical protein